MKQLKVFCLAAALVYVVSSAHASNTPMSHEEAVVRTTYAKLSFAVQVEEIHNVHKRAGGKPIDRAEFAKGLRAAELRFELSDFKVGDLSEISQTKYEELVTKPSGDALDVSVGTWKFTTDEPKETNSVVAIAKWEPSPTVTEDWDVPFGEAYSKTEVGGQHTRYAAFRVKVTFQGLSREYRALFLFGTDQEGHEVVLPVDTIVGINGGSLHELLSSSAYPETLIEGGLGKDPVIYDWLMLHQVSDPAGKRHEANCDAVSLQCGVHSEDLKKLTKPSSRTSKSKKGTSQARLVDVSFRFPQVGINPIFQAATDCTQSSGAELIPRSTRRMQKYSG